MTMYKSGKPGCPAKNDTQDFKAACATEIKRPMNAPMPMSNPMGLKTAMNNTFHGMPAYPNSYVFEGITPEPLRPGDLRGRDEKLP